MNKNLNASFYPVTAAIFLCGILFTSKLLYSDYYGFEILIGILSVVNFLIIPFVPSVKLDKRYYIVFFSYIFVVLLSIANNFASVSHALVYFNLLLFFLVVLPCLNDRFSVSIRLFKFINNAILVVVSAFIILNVAVYLESGLFLSKDRYVNLLSNPNSIGFLVYVGFSFSFLLLTVKREKIYILYLFFYAASLLFVPPVITAYASIFSYILLFLLFKVRGFLRFLLLVVSGISLAWGVYLFSVGFDDLRFLLSYRDVLFLTSFDKVMDSPFFGHGIENWGYLFLDMKNPHNFFLYQLLSFGFLAAFLYLLIFLCVLHISYKKYRNSGRNNYYLHIMIQLIVSLMIMSVFVAMPGNYQDVSILLSIIVAIVFNAALKVDVR